MNIFLFILSISVLPFLVGAAYHIYDNGLDYKGNDISSFAFGVVITLVVMFVVFFIVSGIGLLA